MITKVVGVRFYNDKVSRQEIISKLKGDEQIFLRREPTNRFSKNAIAVMVKGNPSVKIGYVKDELACLLSDFWKEFKFFAKISEVRVGNLSENIYWGVSINITKAKLNKKFKKPSLNEKRG
jgi:hypothetical protein